MSGLHTNEALKNSIANPNISTEQFAQNLNNYNLAPDFKENLLKAFEKKDPEVFTTCHTPR
jgi:hypothetical protein